MNIISSKIQDSPEYITTDHGFIISTTKLEVNSDNSVFVIQDTANGKYSIVNENTIIKVPRKWKGLLADKKRLRIINVKEAFVKFYVVVDDRPILNCDKFVLPTYEISLRLKALSPLKLARRSSSFSALSLVLGHLNDIKQIVKRTRIGIDLPYLTFEKYMDQLLRKTAGVSITFTQINIKNEKLDNYTIAINKELAMKAPVLAQANDHKLHELVKEDLKKKLDNPSFPQIVGTKYMVNFIAKNIMQSIKAGRKPQFSILLKDIQNEVSIDTIRTAVIMAGGHDDFGKAFDRLYISWKKDPEHFLFH